MSNEVVVTLGIINTGRFINPNDNADYGLKFKECSGAEDGAPICVSSVSNNLKNVNGKQKPDVGWVLKQINGMNNTNNTGIYPTLEEVTNYLKRSNYTEAELQSSKIGDQLYPRVFTFEIPAKDEEVESAPSAAGGGNSSPIPVSNKAGSPLVELEETLNLIDWVGRNETIANYGIFFSQNNVGKTRLVVSRFDFNVPTDVKNRISYGSILKSIKDPNNEQNKTVDYPNIVQFNAYLNKSNYTKDQQKGPAPRIFTFEIRNNPAPKSQSNLSPPVISSAGGEGDSDDDENYVPLRTGKELAADWKSRKQALGITIGAGEDEAIRPLNKPSPTNLGPATSSSAATDSTTGPGEEPPKVPISKNFLQMSDIVLDSKGENKGRVVLSNKLVYFGPIQVIDDPVICTVIKTDDLTERPYSINIIKISNQGRVQQGENPVPTDDIEWDAIALPKIIDPLKMKEKELPKDADGNKIQWVSYVMYDIFSSFPNSKNTNVVKDPKTVFGNELFQGFFNAEYNEDVMFNKTNLKRLQRQTFKDLVIYFNALMETLEHIYTHSISSVVNPEKKLCLKDLVKKEASASGSGSSSASGASGASSSGASSSSSASGSSSSASSSNGEQLLSQIEKLYNEGKMKEIEALIKNKEETPNNLLATKINLYVTLARLGIEQHMLNDEDLAEFLNDLYGFIRTSIEIINQMVDPKEKTKYTRLIFKILFYTYQNDTIQKSQIIDLTRLASNLEMVYHANSIKQIIENNIDEGNPDTAKQEAEDLMAKYALEITAADKTDYEKEISETTAAAQKAKADLKWTLAELLFKRAYQLAVVYFGYDSEQEGAAKSQMDKFSELNNKHGSKLIKFVGNLKTQLEMPGSVYSEFLNTDDNNKLPIIADKKDIPKDNKDKIEAVIKAQMASRTTSKLFEVTPTEEIQKQLPGAIIGTLSGIISNMIIQMTLYIYIVNQLRIKEIDDEGSVTMDNNEIILLFNILAGLKIAQQRIIELSAEQNQNNDDDDQINISDGTQVNSAFLNKLMGSVLASGSMLGVLAAVGGKKRRTKKHRRAKGLKSRRLINSINASNSINNSKNRRYKKGRGITRRELRKVKTSRKLRK